MPHALLGAWRLHSFEPGLLHLLRQPAGRLHPGLAIWRSAGGLPLVLPAVLRKMTQQIGPGLTDVGLGPSFQ